MNNRDIYTNKRILITSGTGSLDKAKVIYLLNNIRPNNIIVSSNDEL